MDMKYLKEGDKAPCRGFLIMPWSHHVSDRYLAVGLSGEFPNGKNRRFYSMEEAILELESLGEEVFGVSFEADIRSLEMDRIVKRWIPDDHFIPDII